MSCYQKPSIKCDFIRKVTSVALRPRDNVYLKNLKPFSDLAFTPQDYNYPSFFGFLDIDSLLKTFVTDKMQAAFESV